MSSAIFDVEYHTISAITNHRSNNDPNASFLQVLLLGIYYDTENNYGVPELIEKNIGLTYIQYLENKGFYNRLIYNSQLPDYFQSGEKNFPGIDNKGNRNKAIIAKMQELFNLHGRNIWIDLLFIQLRTFICTTTRTGNETWQASDLKYYFDDALFAATFSYICASSFPMIIPKNMAIAADKQKVIYEIGYDSNYNQTLTRRVVNG